MKFSLSKLYDSRYTALTALGIRQKVEQIMANVFYSTFLSVFLFLPRFFTFFNVSYFSWNVFYI